jgi:hypothetical protein
MKKNFLLIIVLVCSATLVYGQLSGNGPSLSHAVGMGGPPVTARDMSSFNNLVNINGEDGFYLKKDLYLIDYCTIINGEKVLGLPFLFADWLNGTISTPDNRLYTDYKLKYNTQNQTVFFLNGTDSLDVNEEIKEFTLKDVLKDSIITLKFVNANQYQHTSKPLYYELLLDNERGQLLKANTKVVTTSGDGILAARTMKYLNLQSTYFYFDKKTKKLTRIRPNSDMRSVLTLSEENGKELNLETYDISQESELLSLMKHYFEKAKLKGF